MITLPNDHRFEFAAAAGALGYDGRGYPWEWPFRWAGLLRPREFTVITKTLTLRPRRGNLRWYAPWRAVRPLGGGNTVNAVGLTNPGLAWWLDGPYVRAVINDQPLIVSVHPQDNAEAEMMGRLLNRAWRAPCLTAVEYNASCPNVPHDKRVFRAYEIADCLKHNCRLPLIVKVPHDGAVETCRALEGVADAFDLGQSVPWAEAAGPGERSPLARYGYGGAVSGPYIKYWGRKTLAEARAVTRTPLISGGGIDSAEEVRCRFDAGADAVAFGTLFLYKPWLPNRIIAAARLDAPPDSRPQ